MFFLYGSIYLIRSLLPYYYHNSTADLFPNISTALPPHVLGRHAWSWNCPGLKVFSPYSRCVSIHITSINPSCTSSRSVCRRSSHLHYGPALQGLLDSIFKFISHNRKYSNVYFNILKTTIDTIIIQEYKKHNFAFFVTYTICRK